MITTFDAARWAVRAILIASLVETILGLVNALLLFALPPVPGVPGSRMAFASIFVLLPNLVVYGVLLLFGDSIAREVAGGAESMRVPLREVRQLYPPSLSLVGFLVLLPALPALLWLSGWALWTLAQSSFSFGALSLTYGSSSVGGAIMLRSLLTQFAGALARVLVGGALLLWRRLARGRTKASEISM